MGPAAAQMAARVEKRMVRTWLPEVKHWHGAAKDGWFGHLAIEVMGIDTSNVWLEPVADDVYNAL